ncbi:hypothetical protein HHK36_001124 [Tetracentron sinense]|uniref:Remorin n=1 Tax=Tetracentron sinense TaxID=13715 RepID=A0A835DUH0_TETSI|nr:hypothetical protein HHK36_001124 [Tetracentron sinense]
MGEEESKKIEAETPSEQAHPPAPTEAPKVVSDEKTVIPPPEEKVDDSKALAVVETWLNEVLSSAYRWQEMVRCSVNVDHEVPDSEGEKSSGGSIDRDKVLTRVETEKRLSLIKAWEENEKTKAENKAHKKLSDIGSWENSKKADVEAELKKEEERLEKKKAEYVEKMKNKIALIHKSAEEKKAMVEAKRGEDLLKADEVAAKYRATGNAPKKLLGCFGN